MAVSTPSPFPSSIVLKTLNRSRFLSLNRLFHPSNSIKEQNPLIGASFFSTSPPRVTIPLIFKKFRSKFRMQASNAGFNQSFVSSNAIIPEMVPIADKVVLVSNSKIIPYAKSASEFLNTSKRGAYTTARTVNRNYVFELEFHIERLASSVELMMDKDFENSEDSKYMKNKHPEIIDPIKLKSIFLKSLRIGIDEFSSKFNEEKGEIKITALITWTEEDDHLQIHFSPLPSPPKSPVVVEIKGKARSNALAKDSEWVRERKIWEKEKSKEVNEILLLDGDGGVLEGMTSNFFAVKDGKVFTAKDGILLGTVREVILSVCHREGIPVVLEPPKFEEVCDWEGAFISSTSRLALPVDELRYFQKEMKVQGFACPLVNRIRDLVLNEIESNSSPVP